MSRNKALASTALLTWLGLLGCSDPTPPSAEAALTTTIASSATCQSSRGPLSIGESSSVLSANNPGTMRVTNGRGGAKVDCTVKKTDTGFFIDATIEANAIETNQVGLNYKQTFSLSADYPGFAPGAAATASVGSFDTRTQKNAADSNCTLSVTSFGNDGTGGALLASFSCPNFEDTNSPGQVCTMSGVLVLENCAK